MLQNLVDMDEAVGFLRRLGPGWWKDDGRVRAVARLLDDFGSFESPGDVVSFFFEPWKWQREIGAIVADSMAEAGTRR
jgi:hypothetical protein